MSEWRPIETAPKDGALVLVSNTGGSVCIASWSGKKRKYWRYFLGGEMWTQPTHWMPLPEPPE